ncbi:hypothetical protein AYL99_01054 [Fonsecaea erecta]|uniref:Uncharacterized protein n=1 Tax=Fonsecaea erecta TaxID=1367422 RepID=A0A178ZZD2_9EURO|nr:hypothetical protein AYL99_01054 [Fonsecaea erecta]OAP65082.1 hypothetical protein AYL99_01054 [Fonsecaea erecta]
MATLLQVQDGDQTDHPVTDEQKEGSSTLSSPDPFARTADRPGEVIPPQKSETPIESHASLRARMVLSTVIALITCPAMLATAEAIRQGQAKDRREEHRARRCNLVATCVKASSRSQEIDGRRIILRDQKLYVDNPSTKPSGIGTDDEINVDDGDCERENADKKPCHHPFSGYFLPYPETTYEGLVSTISDIPPMLNWIYVDKDTYEVKYGIRVDAQPHVTGPWDCTRQDRRVTLEGWEGFVVVEEEPGLWALYFDREDDGLRAKVPQGKRVLEVELWRREKRWKKDPGLRQLEQAKQNT